MSSIVIAHNPTLTDPEVLAFGRRLAGELILAAVKAGAHLADPHEFPLAPDAALEQLFLERLRSLPAERQRLAAAKSLAVARGAPELRRARVGELADLDLRAATPVSQLVHARARPPLTLSHEKLARAFTPAVADAAAAAKQVRKPRLRPSDATEWLELRLHHVQCVDETDGFLGTEAGSDEITLGALLVDPIQNTTKTPVHDLGSYGSDGEAHSFAPLVVGGFDLRVGFFWPRSLTAVVYLNETDSGNFPEWLQKVFDAAKDKITAAIKDTIASATGAAIGAGLGASVGGPLGAAIGALVGLLVGWAIGELISAIKDWYNDDVFPAANVHITIPGADATWDGSTTSPQFQATYTGHGGEYRLTFDLRMTTRPAGQVSSGLVTGPLEDLVSELNGVAGARTVVIRPAQKTFDPISRKAVQLPQLQLPVEQPLVFALGRADGSMMVRALDRPDSPWQSIGGQFRSGPAVALTGPTRPVVFAIGTDHAMWHTWRDDVGAPWAGWHSLGGGFTSGPGATLSGGRLVVAARGTDDAVWHKWHENGWSDWHSLGGVATSAPALVVTAEGRLVVCVRGTDGAIWHKWYDHGWSDWHSLGGVSTSAPAAVVTAEGRLIVLCRGTDGAIYHKSYDNGWGDWQSLGGGFHSGPTAMLGLDRRLTVVGRGTDGAIYERHLAGDWTDWASLGTP